VGTLLYKRRLGELLLDVTLITLAYYGAYRLRFDAALPPEYVLAFQSTLGLVVAVKIAAFGLFGVYGGAWQYAGIVDLYRIVGALLLSDALILGYGQWRVPALAHSHAIVYIDALLSGTLVLASRLSFRSLKTVRDWLRPRKGTPVVIYGAGDAGELVLRELVNNQMLDLEPVCFIDDDIRKHRATIHGIPVIGGLESLAIAVHRYGVRKIVIGSRKLPLDRLAGLAVVARRHALELMELDLGLRTVPIPPISPGILPGADIERTA
jgi:UDP-GlcNAc:undecaprenyl-phosphate GlcNAc-1-phosphate transferase